MSSAIKLSRKLHNNLPLTQAESHTVRNVSARSVKKLAVYESEITRLQAKLNDRVREEQQLAMFVGVRRSFLSPFRRLLPEIVQEIFWFCLPTAHNALMTCIEAPHLLCTVCHQWRQIALSTPRLWASIHIIAAPTVSLDHPLDIARREAITSWLARSGVLPLSISFFARVSLSSLKRDRSKGSWTNTLVRPYFDLILAFSRRWQKVHFSISRVAWTEFIPLLDATELPILETIHLHGNLPRVGLPTAESLSRKSSVINSPPLRIISLPAFTTLQSAFQLPWNQLTGVQLDITSASLINIIANLRLCPGLEFCSIRFISNRDQLSPGLETFETTPLIFPRLQSLQIDVGCSLPLLSGTFFKHLITPSLRHLSYAQEFLRMLHNVNVEVSRDADGFSELINSLRSFLKKHLDIGIEEMDFFVTPFHPARLTEILSLLPHVKRLSIRGHFHLDRGESTHHRIPVDDSLISRLTPDNSNYESDEEPSDTSCLCPNLEVLHWPDARCSRQALLKFLRSRTVDHQKHRVAHLRRIATQLPWPCALNIEDPQEKVLFEQEIEMLERTTGVRVAIHFAETQPISGTVSPPPQLRVPIRRLAYAGLCPPVSLSGAPLNLTF